MQQHKVNLMNDIDYFETLENTVTIALQEDIKEGDLTAELIPKTTLILSIDALLRNMIVS